MKQCTAVLLGCVLAAATVFAGEATPDEQEVRATLERLAQAYATKDVATVARLYHDDLSYGHSDGRLWTKADAIKDVQDRFWSIAVTDATVTVSGPIAIVRSVLDLQNGTSRAMGRVQRGVRVLYVFTKTSQGWQIIARQALRPPAS